MLLWRTRRCAGHCRSRGTFFNSYPYHCCLYALVGAFATARTSLCGLRLWSTFSVYPSCVGLSARVGSWSLALWPPAPFISSRPFLSDCALSSCLLVADILCRVREEELLYVLEKILALKLWPGSFASSASAGQDSEGEAGAFLSLSLSAHSVLPLSPYLSSNQLPILSGPFHDTAY